MIQKVSSVDKKQYTPNYTRDENKKQNPSFTGVADLLIRGMQRCEAEPMVNVTVLDLSTAIIPRSIIETVAGSHKKDENGNPILDENGKPQRKFNLLAGFEAFRRESSGLFINCILPGAFVMGIASLLNGSIMGKKSNLIKNWADSATLEKINEFYKGTGTENYSQMLKNMFLDLNGADGKVFNKSFADMYHADPAAYDELFDNLANLADAEKLDKKALKAAVSNIVEKTRISENISFISNNPKKAFFGNSFDSLFSNTVEILHDAKNAGINTAEDFAGYIKQAKKLVKYKSLIGLFGVTIPLALAAQPINRWITHKSAGGKKGAPLYNDNEERVLSSEDKKKLLKQKFVSIGSMLGLSWLSMMKLPNLHMLEFKKFFPSMDQARIVSTATFASRMGASEDFNDLRESTVRDLATFSSFYFLGDYAAKGIASFLEFRNKKQIEKALKAGKQAPEEIKLINDLQPLKQGANVLEKFWHWTKHTALKSTSELTSKHAENLRTVCQLGNLTFSLLSLGLFIPLINRIQTNKNEQARKASLAKNAQAATASGAAGTNSTGSTKVASAASTGAGSTTATTVTGAATNQTDPALLPIDKNKTAFGAFFNS